MTLQPPPDQPLGPCVIVDVGRDNICSIDNIRMLLKGYKEEPKADMKEKRPRAESHFSDITITDQKKNGHIEEEPFSQDPADHLCIILLKSGTLRLTKCTLQLDGQFSCGPHVKVSGVTAFPGSKLELFGCTLKGD